MVDTDISRDDSAGPALVRTAPTLANLPRRYLIDAQAQQAIADAGARWRLTGRDTETGQAVFLKLSMDGEAIRREAAILGRLEHPRLARILDWGMHARGGYLVLELVPGATLERRLQEFEPVVWSRQVRPLLATLTDTLAILHAAGIRHRDLKPENVILRPDGAAVIVDFAAARLEGDPFARVEVSDIPDTGYAAPEQFRADASEGPWTDIYALAAIGYRIVTGAPPPPSRLRERDRNAGLPALDRAAVGDPALVAAISIGLSVDPRTRPQNLAAWRRSIAPDAGAIQTVRLEGTRIVDEAVSQPVSQVSFDMARPIRRVPRRARPLLALLIAGLIVPALGWMAAPTYKRQVLKQWTVDASGDGDVRTIAAAIAQAPDGAHIRIRPGTYHESLILNRPLILEPADAAELPVLAPTEGACLHISGDGAQVLGLEMRGAPAAGTPTTETTDSSVKTESENPVAPTATACVVVAGGNALLAGNRVIASDGPAISVENGAVPVIRANSLINCATPAVRVVNGAQPLIEGNVFEASGSLRYAAGGGGMVRANRFEDARSSAIEVTAGAEPEIIDNVIEQPAEAGVYIYEEGKAQVRNNRIIGSGLSGIIVAAGEATIIGNTISGAGEHGIVILSEGSGRVTGNSLHDNAGRGMVVAANSSLVSADNRLEANGNAETIGLPPLPAAPLQ